MSAKHFIRFNTRMLGYEKNALPRVEADLLTQMRLRFPLGSVNAFQNEERLFTGNTATSNNRLLLRGEPIEVD